MNKTKLGFELPVSSSRPTPEAVVAGCSLIGLPHFYSTNTLFTRLVARRSSMTPTYLGVQHAPVINKTYNLSSAPWQATLAGGVAQKNFNDVIYATAEDDLLRGLGSNDAMEGAGGEDLIDGGKGSDRLYGGDGTDIIPNAARMAAGLRVSPNDSYEVPVGADVHALGPTWATYGHGIYLQINGFQVAADTDGDVIDGEAASQPYQSHRTWRR